jgi:acyl carrier protein
MAEWTTLTVAERVKQLINEAFDTDVKDDTNLVQDLDADSLEVATLVTEIENEFEIEIDDSDWEDLRTVGELIAYVAKRVV